MKQSDRYPKQIRHLARRLGAAAAALLCLGLLAATPASAGYEQVQTFAGTPGVLQVQDGQGSKEQERWPEKVQLGGVSGMAINRTGAGGVPPGTLYAATRYSDTRIARFNPDGSFSEAWTFAGTPPKERCGPEGDPAHPVCRSQPSESALAADVEVDQGTGYVYVYDGVDGFLPGTKLIHVYSPDGSKVIAEFGEQAAAGETTAASPEKLHRAAPSAVTGAIAVDGGGDVYVFDLNFYEPNPAKGNEIERYTRLMEFNPQTAGDYEHYVYAGQSHDVRAGFGKIEFEYPTMPVADDASYIYTASESAVAKLDPAQPEAAPLCEFKFPAGGINAMTVDPVSGEVFFSSEKDKKIHQLSPCEGGKFSETASLTPLPKRTYFTGLAFNPERSFGPGRPPGVLYAGAPTGEGGNKEKNEKGELLVESSLGYVFSRPVSELAPRVLAESVAHVTTTTATLGAQINPEGTSTRYAFQYETETQYEANEPADRFAGASEAPIGGALLGEGTEALSAVASLAGLAPDTAYRYRAIATSHCSVEEPGKLCKDAGADQGLHTFPIEAPGLPDKRVYELVSPADKQGGQVFPAEPRVGTCPQSECKPGGVSGRFPMQSAPDGEAIIYEGTPFSAEEGPVNEDQYIAHRDPRAGWQSVNLTPSQLKSRPIGGYKAFDAGLSKGVLLQQESPTLSPEAPSEYANLYAQPSDTPPALAPLLRAEPPNRPAGKLRLEYAGASADLSRIFFEANDALTAETPFAPEAVDGGGGDNNLYQWSEGRLALVNVMPGNAETAPWPSGGKGGAKAVSADGSRVFWADETGQVYLREGAELTRAIATEGTPDPGEFLAASSDGSKVLLQNGHLHYLAGEEPTVDLTQSKGGFLGIAGQSEDLLQIYFVDTAVLDEVPNGHGEVAVAGKYNLYAWNEDTGTRVVARLVAGDNGGFLGGDWVPSPPNRTAEASPDGRFLAFQSEATLTRQDNTGLCKITNNGPPAVFGPGPCQEAFLYDSSTEKLICASCNPSGSQPLGRSFLRLIDGPNSFPQSRYLTDQGRLYFDSRDSLVPADTNHGVEDVYQYEPSGVGTCERFGGCVSLISAGTGTSDSNFLAIDEDGKNVFFTTRDQLALKDKDELIDLYDARSEGGTPSETEVARGECQGEACIVPVSAPNHPTPASSALPGDGNVEEKKAKKHKKKHAKKARHKRATKHNRGGGK